MCSQLLFITGDVNLVTGEIPICLIKADLLWIFELGYKKLVEIILKYSVWQLMHMFKWYFRS